MKTSYRDLLQTRLPMLYTLAKGTKLLYWKKSYLATSGYMKSLRLGRPCDAAGEIVPWMNYSVISFLDQRLNKSMSLFEYGSGYSTQFFAKRVSDVTSLEHDKEWYDKIRNSLPENTNLLFNELEYDGDYCRAINRTQNNYDVVVDDGRDRVRCVRNSVDALSKSGVVILDDVHREKYEEATNRMIALGFRELSWEGLKPNNYAIHKTKIFYKDNNCLNV